MLVNNSVDMLKRNSGKAPPRLSETEACARFWARVDKTNGCWEWRGPKNPKGYGLFHYPRRWVTTAHRVAWMITRGRVPQDLLVCHHCDNRGCVRPDHLFLGTAQDNANDMKAKGRQRNGHTKKWDRLHG